MTHEQLDQIQQQLGIVLPAYYRYYMRSSREDARMLRLVEFNELLDQP